MACLLCGASDVGRRIVDPSAEAVVGAVCVACADEHLLNDERGPTCELCSELADYDLAELAVAPEDVPPLTVMDDLDIVATDVICEEDLDNLKANRT